MLPFALSGCPAGRILHAMPTSKTLLGALAIATACVAATTLAVQAVDAAPRAEAPSASSTQSETEAADAASLRARSAFLGVMASTAVSRVGDLADARTIDRLSAATSLLSHALESADLEAVATRRDDVSSLLVAFNRRVAAAADARLATHASADQPAKDELRAAIDLVMADAAGEDVVPNHLAALRSAVDRAASSHDVNVAAAIAAEAARAASEQQPAEDSDGPATGTGVGGTPTGPVFTPLVRPSITFDVVGDYRPGCVTRTGEWDWWYPDASGYVLVSPAYPFDTELMTFEGHDLAVKSLPCDVGLL